MLNFKHIAIAALCTGLIGCSFDTEANPSTGESLYFQLGRRATLSLEEPSLVGVAAFDADGKPLDCVQPDVHGGTLIARASDEGLVIVEKLDLGLTDVIVEPGVVGQRPIHLTDIRFKLGTQLVLDPEWRSGRNVAGVGHADLIMDWAILTDDGQVLPLATQKVRDVEFSVEFTLEQDDTISAQLNSVVAGPIWDFSLVELSDLSMVVHASNRPVVQ